MKPGQAAFLSATVPRAALLDKLELCCLLKPSLRVMFGALVEARQDCLTIAADNFEILCRVEVPARIEREGSIAFSAQRLFKLLDNAGGDEVVIRAKDEKSLEVTCGGLFSTLACGPVSDFPQRPAWPVEATFEIPNTRAALAWLSPVITDDAQHQGIHFIGDGQTLRIEAVDGRQLHHVAIESSAVVNAIAPANLIRLVKAFEADGGCMVEITERTISFRTEKILICLQLLQGEFPDTSRVIPSPSDKLLTLPKAALENALKAAGAVIEKNFGSGAVNVSVKPASTTIRTDRCTPGSVETVIETSNPFEVDFRIDPVRLLNALKPIDGDEVSIQCNDPLGPACIHYGTFLALIALMRVP